MSKIEMTEFRFTAAGTRERQTGLLGYISFVNGDGLRLDGITLRRTADGRLTLSFPERTDGNGKGHPIIRPIDSSSRLALEHEVLNRLATILEGSA